MLYSENEKNGVSRLVFDGFEISVDFGAGCVKRIAAGGKERSSGQVPLFRVCMRDVAGEPYVFTSFDASLCDAEENGAVYGGFPRELAPAGLTVAVSVEDRDGGASWTLCVRGVPEDRFVEWVEFGSAALPKLIGDDPRAGGGKILFPYNEGVLVSDTSKRERSYFAHLPAAYPSYGCYAMFPNMICSQMLAYLWEDTGLYFGAHDPDRGLKGVDYFDSDNFVELRFRIYSGKGFGEDYEPGFPVVWASCGAGWESAALLYKRFFEQNKPDNVCRISENERLPGWYQSSPLVVSYPVRGVHDMDKMEPNALFPYDRALPVLDKIAKKTGAAILVLLMHWEGTAPWAPPYVWPPFGGEELFSNFVSALHERGMLAGVYCSGFGYTLKSNLVDNYDKTDEFERRGLIKAMCAGPDGKVKLSNICPGQRSGYDMCPASEISKKILDEAYAPLFESGVDYAQILDQNHGGGQYLCYGRDHGHPPAPGKWMTENMRGLLSFWNEKAGKMILGCESAAAEPFLGNLLFNDNRFEINYFIGTPVPLYQFLYHGYIRNFMGNQVCCPLEETTAAYDYRLAYSFACGDCMTVVLNPGGGIMSNWGIRDFSHGPDTETVLTFIGNLTDFYKEKAKKYLYDGTMLPLPELEIAPVSFGLGDFGGEITVPSVVCTAWQSGDGERAIVAVNPSENEADVGFGGKRTTVPALGAALIKI